MGWKLKVKIKDHKDNFRINLLHWNWCLSFLQKPSLFYSFSGQWKALLWKLYLEHIPVQEVKKSVLNHQKFNAPIGRVNMCQQYEVMMMMMNWDFGLSMVMVILGTQGLLWSWNICHNFSHRTPCVRVNKGNLWIMYSWYFQIYCHQTENVANLLVTLVNCRGGPGLIWWNVSKNLKI